MRLQKRLSRKVGKKEYVKWIITVPPEEIKTLGWKAGEDLKIEVDSNILIVQPKTEASEGKTKKAKQS